MNIHHFLPAAAGLAVTLILAVASPPLRAQDTEPFATEDTGIVDEDSEKSADTRRRVILPADEQALQKAFEAELESIGWMRSGAGPLKEWAEIDIPSGYRFTTNAPAVLRLTGNIPGGDEAGVLALEDFDWWILFRFDEVGYVKDDEKDKLDPPKLLQQKQESQRAGNKQREKLGLDALYVEGWAREPFYNQKTNNLEWALLLRASDGSRSVNYNSKILGRKGYMDAVLVCDPEQLEAVLPVFHKVMEGFRYQSGERYAEYRKGDKVATVGLAALIVGGGAAVAAKTGLLAGFLKFFAKLGKAAYLIVAGVVVAIVQGVKRLFGRA